ncbi:zinc ABC transporter substrate-binding protein [Vibrio sp. TH_r3]|uniref:zinc ABC transporter substrate-binding protein n=1 Tax=Vibrio sp. TH_r3 TaxID=3082084 RepID=UPI0029538713|nr:zinc ABC transporter substrate-binding protein [Vibrio sp. TH_r3]MDV7103127.1 zinc ABC transporter substrate-binding protein [Vibrio sp. TH_r3]
MKSLSKIGLCVVALLSLPTQAMTILTSIKPLQLIVTEITDSVSTPELLLSSTASPHDYALKPSDLSKIKNADLVVWFGPDLEPFLTKVIGESEKALWLSKSDITLRSYSKAGHDGHNHGNFDPHIWLGPIQAEQTAKAIAAKLIKLDKENAAVYQANLERFVSNLSQTEQQIKTLLSPHLTNGYYVFHDAYEYFESYFDLNNLGHFTLSPDRKPGAKTLIQIRSALRKGEVKCVFSEPQFEPAIIETVTRGSDVYIGVLDPLATDVELKKGGYFQFLTHLANDYVECLSYGNE